MTPGRMAEALLIKASVEVVLQKIISVATEGINLVFGSDPGECCCLSIIRTNWFSHPNQDANPVEALREELERLKVCLSRVEAVRVDSQGPQDNADIFTHRLQKLGDLAYDADLALADFDYEILRYEVLKRNQAKGKVGSRSSKSYSAAFRDEMLPRARDIITKLELINKGVEDFPFPAELEVTSSAAPRPQFKPIDLEINSLILDPKIIGREKDVSKIAEMLAIPRDEVLSVFSIHGVNGIGKTTLAQLVYNDQRVTKRFDGRIWVGVSGDFKIKGLLKLILEALTVSVAAEIKIKEMVKQLEEKLGRYRFLLVLDDIQNVKPEKWEEFKLTLVNISRVRGSCVVVITEIEQDAASVAAIESHFLHTLSPEHCWSIIKEKASTGGETTAFSDWEDIGRGISEKCQGLPLAANLLGGLLRGKGKEFWLSILGSGVLDAENIVPEILKLIFECLPSPFLQRCFAFTSMLPRNSVIETMRLVQLWMAEGFLDSAAISSDAEEVGHQYFDILLHCSLLQAMAEDKFNKITHCKLHNVVHDFASSISIFDSINFDGGVKNEVPQIRHLALEFFNQKNLKIAEENAGHLRTLLLKSKVPEDVSLDFNSLHVLNLCGAEIEELPSLVGNLTQLQYLDLSMTKIKFLPGSICDLYKLQTLRIPDCCSLEGLTEFKNLLSLRHLHFCHDESFHVPLEIGQLTNLQTLPVYKIQEAEGARLEELKRLTKLRGKLEICNLELVKDKKEAEQAYLFGKTNLQELQLHWCSDALRDYNDENVLDGLQPHPNLRSLVINKFNGDRFPSWAMNMSVRIDQGGCPSRLNNLVEVKLTLCNELKEIPTLGLLPLLRHLELRQLLCITRIGPSFYDESESKRNHNDNQIRKAYFPALKSLALLNLCSLKDWTRVEEMPTTDEVEAFPNLERLSVEYAYSLETAPSQFPSLKELSINGLNKSSLLENILCNSTTLTNLQIRIVDGLACLPDGLLQNNPNLAHLHIERCPSLTHIFSPTLTSGSFLQELVIRECEALQELPADLFDSHQCLEKLEISKCPCLISVPVSNGHGGLTSLLSLTISKCAGLTRVPSELIESCKHLQSLRVEMCENLIEFSADLRQTPHLLSFQLCQCPKLMSTPKGLGELNNLVAFQFSFSNSVEFEAFKTCFTGTQKLSSVRCLSLDGHPQWDSLPEELQYLPDLNELTLRLFGIESLPDWIEKLSSIQELNLYFCRNLQRFPSKKIMRRLKKLRMLRTFDCPLLYERWFQQSDPGCEWSKVSHIPKIFDGAIEVSAPGYWDGLT